MGSVPPVSWCPHPHCLAFLACRYVPHVIEPSIGVDRLFLALICSAYAEDEIDGEKRVLLKFHPAIAPIKVQYACWESKDAYPRGCLPWPPLAW